MAGNNMYLVDGKIYKQIKGDCDKDGCPFLDEHGGCNSPDGIDEVDGFDCSETVWVEVKKFTEG